MKYLPIECEVFTTIIEKKDCAYHKKLGWSKTKWHAHNRGQLMYAEYGIMRLYVGSNVYYIPSWHAAWIPRGVKHKVVTESQDLLFYTLYLEHEKLSHPFYSSVGVFPVSNMLREMITFTKKWQLNGVQNKHEASFLSSIKHLLPDHAGATASMHVPIPTNTILLKITEYIRKHLAEKQKAPEIAKQFALSERTMHRLFLKDLGMSYRQYQKLMRMVKAAELLSAPGKNVGEVVYEVGYESVPSFTRSFKEMMGSSPARFYRKQS